MAQKKLRVLMIGVLLGYTISQAYAESIDNTQAHNSINAGIHKSLAEEVGAGRGDILTPNSSMYIIKRDPFRSIRRGRQLFQRKFTRTQGQGPGAGDGVGDIDVNLAIGAGLADSCAACHGRPRGSGGFGGDVATRPDSRDSPHLFGLGLKEMLADEITAELRTIKSQTLARAQLLNKPVTKRLVSKGINYGSITANPDGTFDTTQIQGVNTDLRVRPFFAQGGTISIREFIVGAANGEMGLQASDPGLYNVAINHGTYVTPSGMVLDGSLDQIEAPPTNDPSADPDGDGVVSEMPESIVDHLEFYLLNYFKPATYEQTNSTIRRKLTALGAAVFGLGLLGRLGRADQVVEREDADERGKNRHQSRTTRLGRAESAALEKKHDLVADHAGLRPCSRQQLGCVEVAEHGQQDDRGSGQYPLLGKRERHAGEGSK